MNKNKNIQCIIAYLPVFAFSFAYITIQYCASGAIFSVPPIDALRTLIILTLFLIGCVFIARRFSKNHNKAGLVLLVMAELIIFSERFFIISGILSCIAILLWMGISWLRKKKVLLEHISFLLVSLGLGLTLAYSLPLRIIPWDLYLQQVTEKSEKPNTSLNAPSTPPDIYFIILDGYIRSDVLKELYGFENSDFTNYLVDNNFIIPKNNHSNYAKTTLSVSSTLNLQYVQTLLPDAERWPFWWLMNPYVKNSQVKMMLKEAGYKTVSVASEWDIANIENADIFLKPFPIQLNDFEKMLFQSSPLRLFTSFFEKFTQLNSYPSHRKMIDFGFKALAELPKFDNPSFVFAHITALHPPFVFDKDGTPVLPAYRFSFADDNDFPGSQEQYRTGYVGQLQFINQQMKRVIDLILKKSDTPPIIIIVGDHGSGMLTDYISSADSCMRERFSNFAAFSLPGLGSNEIPSDISSVNIFRFIFNQYFGTKFELLNNEYYFPGNPTFIYTFEDVTERVDKKCEILQ